MKTRIIAGIGLVFILFLTLSGKTKAFQIDGYVVTEQDHHPVKDQIVEIVDHEGNPVAWFVSEINGLYSGNFEIDDTTITEIIVKVTRTCDNELVVYSNIISLDNQYLICNFFVCEFRSCKSSFYYTQTNGNELVFQFTDVSGGNITSWFWDFGDTQTSTLQNPVHQYAFEDHYNVVLEITTDSCTDQRFRWVNVFQTECLADFSFEQINQGNNLNVQFTNQSTGDYNHIHWDFGDGGMPSNQPDPLHEYDEPGEYEVELHIWKQGGGGPGCDHITKKIISVEPASTCYALFTSVQHHSGVYDVQFSDASIGNVASWLWDFGDQTFSTVQNPLHIYQNPGEYQVTLEISGPEGSSSFSRTIGVQQSNACLPDFIFSQTSIEEPRIDFINLSVGEYLEFLWDFGDGTFSTDSSPTHIFPAAGIFDVTLFTQGYGCADSIIKAVEVLVPPPCHAAFSFSSESPEALEISFNSESSGIINSFLWDFGDGTFSVDENPVHTYSRWGGYDVWLEIDAVGCKDSILHQVQIAEPEFCKAAFSWVQEYPQSPLVSFVNESEGSNFSSHWDFGDESFSEEANPQHEYQQPGQYLVQLIINTAGGCSDSITHPIEIIPPLSISGNVMAGTNLFGYGNIYLYKTDDPEGFVVFGQAPLGSGNFSFSGLTPGNYLIQAVPDFDFPFPVIPNYFPTYAGGESHWADAQVLSTQNLPEFLTIGLLSFNDFFDGSATISGVVNLLPPASDLPLIMYLSSQANEIFDFKVTDASGSFSFEDIPYGIYQLYPEKAGKSGQAIIVEVSETKPENQNIVFIETAGSIYPDLTLTDENAQNLIRLFPNPCTSFFYVDFKKANPSGELCNMNILTTGGKVVKAHYSLGSIAKIDVTGLAEGMYFLCFNIENQILHSKLIIQR